MLQLIPTSSKKVILTMGKEGSSRERSPGFKNPVLLFVREVDNLYNRTQFRRQDPGVFNFFAEHFQVLLMYRLDKEIQWYHTSYPLSICDYLTDFIRSTKNFFILQQAQFSLHNKNQKRQQNGIENKIMFAESGNSPSFKTFEKRFYSSICRYR